MKTRNGFVSNSSSSSFIVALDQPATVEYLKNVLFNNEEEIPYYYNSNWRGQETFFSSTELANEVFSALTKYETISPYERDLLEIIKEYDEKGLKLAIEMYKDKICQSHIVGFDDTFEKELLDIFGEYDKNNMDAAINLYKTALEMYDEWGEGSREEENRMFEFAKTRPNTFIYTCSFSDENGEMGSHLEHGETFNNFDYIRFSHH